MRWAREHPEQMAEIARLPLCEQPRALRDAVADHDERMREAQTIARLELTRDGRGDEAYPEDAHLEADYEDRQNGGE